MLPTTSVVRAFLAIYGLSLAAGLLCHGALIARLARGFADRAG